MHVPGADDHCRRQLRSLQVRGTGQARIQGISEFCGKSVILERSLRTGMGERGADMGILLVEQEDSMRCIAMDAVT